MTRLPVAMLAVLATLATLAVALAMPLAALADTVTVSNTLVTNTDATKAPGGTGTANAWLVVPAGNPPGDAPGCNVTSALRGTVTFTSNNPDVTFPNGNTAQLSDCFNGTPSSTNVASVAYKVADGAQAGQAVIKSSVAGGKSGSTYNENDTLTVTIAAPAKQTTSVALDPTSGTYGGSATLKATLKTAAGAALSGKSVDFTLNGASVGSVTTDSNGVATKSADISGVGAGTHANYVSANFAGDTSNNGSTASGNLTVDKAQATLTLNGLGGHTYNGQPQGATVATDPADLGGVTITYNGSQTQPTNAGSYNVVASLNNPNYTAQDTTGTLDIAKATPNITWNNPADITSDTPLGDAQLNASADVDGSFVYTPASGAKLDVGDNQSLKADFTPSDAGNYNSASKTVQINVTKASQPTPVVGRAAGPVDPSNGFPYWYQDKNNLRLDLCLDPNETTSKCLVPFELPAERPADLPADALRFPDYFPGEAFWWTGEASMTMSNNEDALLVMAQEAAFANEEPREGDQAVFGRIRIRVDGLEAGQTYRVIHPYGVEEFVAEPVVDGSPVGEINSTEDVGCLLPSSDSPCQFGQNGHVDESLSSRIDQFLTWDNFGQGLDENGAPMVPELAGPDGEADAFVGDPTVDHAVTGSPNDTNYFKVEKLNDDGSVAEELGQTDQFAVSGKVATPQVDAAPYREIFNSAKDVTLVPSDPSYDVYYTVGEGDPAATGQRYSSPIHLEGTAGETQKTTLRFVAVDPATGKSSPVVEKTYTIDRQAPSLGADPAGGTYDTPQTVTLSTENAADEIFYTTDGSNPALDADGNPTGSAQEYTEAIKVARTQAIKAIAVDELGNKSQVETYRYTIASLAETGPINPQGGYPFWYRDANGVQLDLCLDPQDAMCLQPFEMPDPTATEVSFPENFPGESFWWTGEADLGLPGSKKSLLVMAQEAAFANENPVEGDQMSFGRIRIRIDGLQIGTKYRVSHPYGTDTFTAEDDGKGGGEINVTEDIGCFPSPGAPCDFDAARFGRVGPFLTWDNFGDTNNDPALRGANGEPNAYVGDPNVEHAVKGSPVIDENGNAQNYFKLERLNNSGSVVEELGRTDLFAVSGKVSKLQVGTSKQGGTYKAPQDVLLRASDKNATIYYTTDGSEPTTASPDSFVGQGTVNQVGNANGGTTLKFVAVGANGTQSQVFTETYEVDTTAPGAPAVPQLDAASDSGAKGDYITNDTTPTLVGTAEAGTRVKILSGSNVVGSAAVDANGNYSLITNPLSNGERQLAIVVSDRATNESASTGFKVTIDTVAPARPSANPAPGTYAVGQTVSFNAEANASIYYTTDTSAPTVESTQYNEPITLNSSQTFNVIAVDRAGNASREISFAYVIDSPNRPPTISAMTPAEGTSLRDRTPTITATVSDAETNLAAANISLRLDGATANFTYNRTTDGLTFTPRQKLAPGRHTVRLVATDARGERTVEAWSFTITR